MGLGMDAPELKRHWQDSPELSQSECVL